MRAAGLQRLTIGFHVVSKRNRCRTLEDAQRALAAFEGSSMTKADGPWSPEEFEQFTGRIHYPQRLLLAKLLEHGTARLEDWKLRDLLDLADNKALAGTLSGVSKVALMFGIDPRRVSSERILLERQIAASDQQIDRLIYDLYGLTEQEIIIIEASIK